MEILSIDASTLALKTIGIDLAIPSTVGITERMRRAAAQMSAAKGINWIQTKAATHRSDTIRGWAVYALMQHYADHPVADVLPLLQPFAADAHFAVREWAWLALRPFILAQTQAALVALEPWVWQGSIYYQRFAIEATRPRGVWSPHISLLKTNPALGTTLLTPLHASPAPYVQNSLGNWLNDAAKTQPEWIWQFTEQWLLSSASPHTARIVRRARRSWRGQDRSRPR